MPDYEVSVDGIDDLVKRLDDAGDTKTLRDGMTAVAQSITSVMKVYPPKPAGSKYQRTMQLRNKWTYAVDDDGSRAIIGNFAVNKQGEPYAPYVQGREQQTWFHKLTGWKTAEDTLDERKDKITEILRAFITRALERKG